MDRPDPDSLLQQLNQQEQKAKRGKLRIYFGAVAGVGKTYAMLRAAQELQKNSHKKIVVGYIETHGRKETEKQLIGLTCLSRKNLTYKGKIILEFDLDQAIAMKPDILLVDELAHTNIEGGRHPKRWQDIDELLSHGIDVWTTLNVQHLESLNHVISQITTISVYETVPDVFFDSADEIILVDTTTDELLHRLKTGKIYKVEQARRAFQHFFRKGNLISLREIALRRTADRIKSDVKTYRQEQSLQTVWQTETGILAYLTYDTDHEHLIRTTARWAQQLGCVWHILFIEAAQYKKKSIGKYNYILKQLQFARSLGAVTSIINDDEPENAIIHYAYKHNLAKILYIPVIKTIGSWWKKDLIHIIMSLAPELEYIQISQTTVSVGKEEIPTHSSFVLYPQKTVNIKKRLIPYIYTVISTIALAVILWPISFHIDGANIVLFFLLLVMLSSIRFGRNVGIFASIIGILTFDFCFIRPKFSLNVSDLQYLITFGVMLFVGSISSQLMAHLKYRAKIAKVRENRVQTLFQFARSLSGFLEYGQVIQKSIQVLTQEFGGKAVILMPASDDQLCFNESKEINMAIAQWAFHHKAEAGFATDTLPKHQYRYLPLTAPVSIRGILALSPKQPYDFLVPEKKQLLDTITSLIAIALERIHFADAARQVLIQVESEQLRNTLLSTISHDLRTPLTSLMGQAEYLVHHYKDLTSEQLYQNLRSIYDGSRSIHEMVCNVLDMARIDTGHFKINISWQSVEEVIGSVLHQYSSSHPEIYIKVNRPSYCPLVEFDPVLIGRVINNLIENAIKYSDESPDICIEITYKDKRLFISVLDRGIGIALGQEVSIFEKFNRGKTESSKLGAGLGLSIAKTIVEAHHGKIFASQRIGGGSCFTFYIPANPEPSIELEEAI
ncbi:sensor histidine kinase KdpD [Commensalibacter oyaizuii]|uniref:histidine kinase n=1 Tax=Commensalibacter oyaizuii TaxID=3043873 RepID=A0ABT6PZ54_9PROT|nr:sensor histidine kinase KdpD [Commensalibacter sp. TBRC 16381]MDI2090099.1 sensor histidine kinase KdpD [Commensalibacter sp. TBRC 16381]